MCCVRDLLFPTHRSFYSLDMPKEYPKVLDHRDCPNTQKINEKLLLFKAFESVFDVPLGLAGTLFYVIQTCRGG